MNGTTKTSVSTKLMSILLSVLMVLSLIPVDLAFAAAGDSQWAGVPDGERLVKSTVTHITDGVFYREVICNVPEGNRQQIDYIAEITPSDTIKVATGYGLDDGTKWSLTPTTKQAKAYEEHHPGETVVAAINADFFNMATGQPQGALVMEGKVYNPAGGRPYFGITKEGKAVIRYGEDLSDLQAAVGGDIIMVENGQVTNFDSGYGSMNYSRAAIGIKPDGTIMTFITHGRLNPISYGRTYMELAQMMQRGGCETVLALDGGGSATFCARPEGTDKLEVRNSPNDGAEREVSSTLLFISTATATGVFDHAVLSPNNELYTPGSEVQFSAVGVDTAGKPVDLPEDVTYALSAGSENMGTIDPVTGVLKANENCGVVGVDMVQNGKVVGSTTIEIATPDHIYFANEEISLGFSQETDFGLVVRNQDRDLNIKAGDIIWSIENIQGKDGATAEDMGTFNGNIFTSSDGKTVNGNVVATSKWDESVKGSIHTIVGMLPTIIWDFEDYTDEATGAVIPAEEYYTGANGILTHSNYGRGGKESVEIVSREDEEPVRFGAKSLKLNFDFRDCGAVTEGACVGTTTGMTVPGVPTGIGAWVYAPEGVGITYEGPGTQAGFWLRGYVRDGAGNNMPYDFVLEPKACNDKEGNWLGTQPGISWTGWKYLEADLTKLSAPLSIQPGMTFRLMYVDGTPMGTKTAGSIYFDNLQFVYGANVDDVDAPVVDSITVNGKELENGAVIEDAKLKIDAIFHDVENKYTSGIDMSTIRMYIDDVNVVGNDKYQYAVEPDGTMSHLYDLELENGEHSVTVYMCDGFGNEVTETRTFFVKKAVSTATVQVVPLEKTAIIGKTVDLQILASDATVAENTTVLTMGSLFTDYEVIYADGYQGTAKFNKLTKKLTVKTTREADAAVTAGENGCLLATVRVQIPDTLSETDVFNYTVKGGSFTTDAGAYATYFRSETKVPVGAEYTISAKPIIVSEAGTGTLSVVNAKGEPAANVTIYIDGTNEVVGVTDENGVLTTDRFGKTAGMYTVYAKDESGLLSFRYKVGSYAVTGEMAPYNVRFNAPEDESTQKNLSWISNPTVAGEQSVRYAVRGTEDWQTVKASSTQFNFVEGGYIAANFNNVILTGLTPNTTYDYQVGCEDTWTELASFTTADGEKDHADFFALGDIQAEDLTNITAIRDALKDRHWNFGIQTGDAVDNPRNYKSWEEYTALFNGSTMGSTNMVQVLGNHELQGEALESKTMFGLDASYGGSCYSRTYGNVYLAVINYTGNASQLREALEWLKQDAHATTADWKILTMHQPAYYTNVSGGNAEIQALVPAAVEEAGIDVVLSGHDHSFARTNLLRGGEIDEKTGILYYICGSSGEKSYSISSQDVFDYEKIFSKATLDFNGIYLVGHADADTLTIDVYDVGTEQPIDTFTMKSNGRYRNEHTYQLNPETEKAECTVCGEASDTFSGEIQDAAGNDYYMLDGKLYRGWVPMGEEIRYYNEKTGIRETLTTEPVVESTCIITGKTAYTSESGATKIYTNPKSYGHEYVDGEDGTRTCSVCGYVQVDLKTADAKLGYQYVTYTGKKMMPSIKVTDHNGDVLSSVGEFRDYAPSYENNREVGTASVTLKAVRYGKYINLNEWRGNCSGEVTLNYEIRPDLPTDVKVEVQGDKAVISWTAALSQPEYVIYRTKNAVDHEEIATTEDTSVTVPLDEVLGYRIRISTRKMGADGQMHKSTFRTGSVAVCPVVTGGVSQKSGFPVLKWDATYNAAEYEIFRANTENGEFVKCGQVSNRSFTDTTAMGGVEYFYKVRAINKDGSIGSFSPAVRVICGCAMPEIGAWSDTTGSSIHVYWEPVAGAKQYEIYRCTTKNGTYKLMDTVDSPVAAYEDVTVVSGYMYYYKVKAIGADEQIASTFSAVVSGVSRCAVPTNCTAKIDAETGKLVITWKAVSGASGYEIVRQNYVDETDFVSIGVSKSTTFIDTTASAGIKYSYRVRAISKVRSEANSDYSSNLVIAEAAAKAPVVTVGFDKISGKPVISWTEDFAFGNYEIYRSGTRNGTYKMVSSGWQTTFTDESAKAGYVYYYKVRVVGSKEILNSPFSAVVSAMSHCAMPELKTAYNHTTGKPVISWGAVSGAVKYEVYRAGSKNGTYKLMTTTNKLSYTDTTAGTGYIYYYKVKAISSVRSEASSEFSVIMSAVSHCAKPVVKTGFNQTTGKPVITWTAVSGAVEYNVYRSGTKNGTYKLVKTTKSCSYTDTAANAGYTYFYKVEAVSKVRASATSDMSAVQSAVCHCAKPVVTTSVNSKGQPRLTWTAVSGAAKYNIYRSTSKDGEFKLMYTAKGTTYTNTSAKSGKTYYYKVEAVSKVRSSANSVFSSVMSVTAK